MKACSAASSSIVPHWSCLLTPFQSVSIPKHTCICSVWVWKRVQGMKQEGVIVQNFGVIYRLQKLRALLKLEAIIKATHLSSTKPRDGRKERLISATMEALAEPQTQSSYFFSTIET
ncbi:hypothetical protein GBA52_021794 [Prunus armeniaca]|nr:hypothetical protein GBA52_021794 [Prunus armeniaca]